MATLIYAIIGTLVVGIPLTLWANRMVGITMASYDFHNRTLTVVFADGFVKEYTDDSLGDWYDNPMKNKASKLMQKRLNKIMRYITTHGSPYPIKHLLMEKAIGGANKVNVKNKGGMLVMDFYNGKDKVGRFNTTPENLYGMLKVGNLYGVGQPSPAKPNFIRSLTPKTYAKEKETVRG